MIISTLAAMTAGYVLGVLLGTPRALRAERYIKKLCDSLAPKISAKYQDSEDGQHTAGTVYLLTLLLIAFLPLLIVLVLLYAFLPAAAIILDAIVCWSLTDIKGYGRIASAASRSVKSGNLTRAAKNAAKLSETDCSELDGDNIIRAAVQGSADRTVDYAAATLLYMFILSGPGGVFWKVADVAAKLDYDYEGEIFAEPVRRLRDALCYIPGKLAMIIMLVDALFLKLNTRAAERTMKRDSKKCERRCFGGCRAVLAGITGISLLPEEVYSEQFLRTYTIGEHLKEPSAQDILLANQLMNGTAFIIMLLLFVIKLTIGVWF